MNFQPDIEGIMRKHNVERPQLVMFSAALARAKKCTPTDALRMIQESDDIMEFVDFINNGGDKEEFENF